MIGPRRTCIGCRRVRPKSELIRIVRGPDGLVGVDPEGSAPGRGAYVCGEECMGLARRHLGRALRARGVDAAAVERAVTEWRRQPRREQEDR